jgi:hypothetical protein
MNTLFQIIQFSLLSVIVLIVIAEFALANIKEKRLQEQKVAINKKRKQVFDF